MALLKFIAVIVCGAVLAIPQVRADPVADEPEVLFDVKGKQILPDTPKTIYIYCRLKAAMDAKREGQDFWIAEKAGKKPCAAPADMLADKKLSRYISNSIARYFEGE